MSSSSPKRNGQPKPSTPAPRGEPRHVSWAGMLLALLLWLAALVLLYSGTTGPHANVTVGQRAPATVVAAVDFTCQDLTRTELSRRQAANAVPVVFSISHGPQNTAIRTLDKLFERLAQINQATGARAGKELEREIGNVLDLLGLPLTSAEARRLAPAGREAEALGAIKNALGETWARGVASSSERQSSFQGVASAGKIAIRTPEGGVSGPTALDRLPLPDEALAAAVQRVMDGLGEGVVPKTALSALLKPWVVPNLAYDPLATDEHRAAAAAAVRPVNTKVVAGTTMVEAGERITAQILEELRAHNVRLNELKSPYDRLIERVGKAGLLMAVLIACVGLLQVLRPEILRQDSRILLLAVLSLLALFPAKGLLQLSGAGRLIPPAIVPFAMPLALAPLLASILLGSGAAIPVGLWNSVAMAALLENDFSVLALGLLVTVVTTLSTQDVRRRSQIFRAGLFAGFAGTLYAVSLAAIAQPSWTVVGAQVLASLAGGIVCALLASVLTPVFETLFGITTNLTLLELCDMANPLLQRMAMEAPGTYHHSIVVANLGQAAAARIGANSLLVRAAAYFHDIGKLSKPEYFTENMHLRDNPHDDLAPHMSALVITSHVKEGLHLARRYRLPRSVIDGIEQHHGTGLASYFYRRAKQQEAEGSAAVQEDDFRYAGPRPRSREMAILLLADAVEAAARSLEKPTPHRIRNLVDEIADAKLHDHQLDASELTLAQLTAIKDSFAFTLGNMLHVRIAYPQDETKPVPSTDKGAATSAGDTAPGVVAPEPGPGARAARPLE